MSSFRKVLMVMLILAVASGSALAANVTFQVNMSFAEEQGTFDPATNQLVIRGSMNEWGGNDWELLDDDSDGIYVGTFAMDDGDYEYKFVIPEDGWEGVDNRTLTVAGEDITLDVVWWNNQEPVTLVTIDVLFQVDMSVQNLGGNFDYAVDSVTVRGGTAPLEWGGRPVLLTPESAAQNIYSGWVTFTDIPESAAVEYKFFKAEGGDWDGGGWESVDNRTFDPTDAVDGELILDLVYFDNVTVDDILTENLDVIFVVNMQPAFLKLADPDSFIVDIQTGVDTVFSIDDVYVQGFFSEWTWGGIGDEYMLFDNGVDPDAAADDFWYTGTVTFYPGDNKNLIYKFGINALDVEAGFAMNHSVMLSNDNPTQTVVDTFGTNDTLYEIYYPQMSVREVGGNALPNKFSLEQNYPNPFNPSTTIAFNLPAAGPVTFRVFNVMGQEVVRNELGHLNAGRFELNLDAADMASGVYFYKVESVAGSDTKRMMLLK